MAAAAAPMIIKHSHGHNLVYDNYLLKKDRTYPTKQHWRCVKKGCPGRVHTDLANPPRVLSVRGEHNHIPDEDLACKRQLKAVLCDRAKDAPLLPLSRTTNKKTKPIEDSSDKDSDKKKMKPNGPPLPQKLVIDVDTGIDDAHALMLALSSPEVEVVAITCANGNVKIDDVVDNTLRVLQVCNRMDVPVYRGAARSMLGKVSTFDNFESSVWTTPVNKQLKETEHAANALVRLANQMPGEITLVALAPLTNVAMAVNLDPDFPSKLRELVIMGGSTDGRGRVTPCAEFNFYNDPEAAYVVLNSMKSIRLLPFDVCCRHTLSWEFMEEWTGTGTPKSNFLRDSLDFSIDSAKSSGRQGYRTCDGFAMATVIDRGVAKEEKEVHGTVELWGMNTRGQLVLDWTGVMGKSPNLTLIMDLDNHKIKHMFRSMTS